MPLFKESEFKKHISSGKFENLYVICGEEKMLVKHYTRLLCEKIAGKEPNDFNFHTFGDDMELEQFNTASMVVPFVSEYNCVKISDYDIRAIKKDDYEAFMNIIKNIPDTTIVIYTLPTLLYDAKKAGNIDKLIKYATKNGGVLICEKQGTIQIERTLVKWANENGAELSQINASKIANYCGHDLNLLHNEILKLSSFADGGEITTQMIENMVTKNLEARIFDLVDDIIYKKSDEVFKKLNILFYQREDPIAIVSALSMSFTDMYRVRVASESGEPLSVLKENFATYKSREWVLKKTAQKISRIPTASLQKCIDELLAVDVIFKSTATNRQIELEKLVSRLMVIL